MGCVTQGGEQAFAFGRNCVLASSLPRLGSGSDDRSPVRFLAAGAAIRGAGGDVGHAGHGDCGGCRKHDPGADEFELAVAPRAGDRHRAVVLGDPAALRCQGIQPVPRCAGDCRQVRPQPRSNGCVRARKPPPRPPLPSMPGPSPPRSCRCRPLRACSHTDDGLRRGGTLEKMGEIAALTEGGSITAANASQMTRWRIGRVGGERTRAEGPRPHSAGADRQPDGDRGRSGDHARRAHRRRPARPCNAPECGWRTSTCTK